jgi:hypothetical protein
VGEIKTGKVAGSPVRKATVLVKQERERFVKPKNIWSWWSRRK